MSIETVREVFNSDIAVFGEATRVIYATGGLMAHHDLSLIHI